MKRGVLPAISVWILLGHHEFITRSVMSTIVGITLRVMNRTVTPAKNVCSLPGRYEFITRNVMSTIL
jgi:hypothetical protein